MKIKYEPSCVKGTEDQIDKVINSKAGFISIKRKSDGEGINDALVIIFGEGLACYCSNEVEWYMTSNVQHIDWEKSEFQTLNSTYEFKFEELDDQIIKELYDTIEGKSEETESES